MMNLTLVSKSVMPFGCKTVCCGKTAKAGQWVLWHKIPDVMNVVVHRTCMEDAFEEVDSDTIDGVCSPEQMADSAAKLKELIGEFS